MIIYSLSDIHDNLRELERVCEAITDADLILISGDLTNRGGREEARRVIDTMRSVCDDILAVPGNMDTMDVLHFLEDEGISLHGKGRSFSGIGIIGVGGSPPTPFHTPFEMKDEDFYLLLQQGYSEIKGTTNFILLSHTPPYGTLCDKVRFGLHVGSRSIRRFIEETNPILCLSGHIHEARGKDTIKNTTILNPGPVKHGSIVRVEIEKDIFRHSIEDLF